MRGHAALAAMNRGFRSAYQDLKMTVHEIITGDGATVLDFALSGTHRGEFMGIPATDRPFDFRGVVISRYRDGRIASEWEIMDTMTLLQQLGAA